jgi:hypothetical protein
MPVGIDFHRSLSQISWSGKPAMRSAVAAPMRKECMEYCGAPSCALPEMASRSVNIESISSPVIVLPATWNSGWLEREGVGGLGSCENRASAAAPSASPKEGALAMTTGLS